MAETKSYMVDIRLELVTEDDEEVKAVRIHGMKHDPLPLSLTCDFLDRIQMMTPGEPVMCMASVKPREPLVENGKMYVLMHSDCQFQAGDYFKAFGDRFLQHVRSGEVVEVTEGNVEGFVCCGDSQAFTEVPASPEEVGFTDRIIEKIKNIKDGGQ